MNQPTKARYAVGIDPDIERSGYAVYDRAERKLVTVTTLSITELVNQVQQITPGTATFYVEAGWLNKGYHHYASLPTNLQSWSQKSRDAYLIRCGVDVGRNFGSGQTIVDLLRGKGHPVHEIRPQSAKWTAKTLLLVTGWKSRTNQDARDAAKLCFGR